MGIPGSYLGQDNSKTQSNIANAKKRLGHDPKAVLNTFQPKTTFLIVY